MLDEHLEALNERTREAQERYAKMEVERERELKKLRVEKAAMQKARALAKARSSKTITLGRFTVQAMLSDPACRHSVWLSAGAVGDDAEKSREGSTYCKNKACLFSSLGVLPRDTVEILHFQSADGTFSLTLCEWCINEKTVSGALEAYGDRKDAKGVTRGRYENDSIWDLYNYELECVTARVPDEYILTSGHYRNYFQVKTDAAPCRACGCKGSCT
jgi:hypothetical protein